jgi:serine protease Do
VLRKLLFSLVLIGAGFAGGVAITERVPSLSGAAPASDSLAPLPPAAEPPGGTSSSSSPSAAEQRAASSAPAIAAGPDFTHVAGQAVKGVANISSLQVVQQRRAAPLDDPFFSYFFGNQDLFGPRTRQSLSLGSGVIVSTDGYIVTNNHVVGENMREIRVSLPDKRELPGKVVGADPATDIALLKIETQGLPAITWGDSGKLLVGEWVLAIGSPFQLSQTVTAGIVSATGRANVGFAQYEDFIQTDAAINPGNSGGALINIRGELVGINTGIFSQSGGYQGIGFAVPSNLAKHVIDDLKQYGQVRRGTIGGIVSIEGLTPQYAQELGAPNTNGAVVSRMARNSEAYNAGIRPGDVIVGFNGQQVSDQSQLYRMVADSKIGSTATIRVMRDANGRALEFRVPIVQVASGR